MTKRCLVLFFSPSKIQLLVEETVMPVFSLSLVKLYVLATCTMMMETQRNKLEDGLCCWALHTNKKKKCVQTAFCSTTLHGYFVLFETMEKFRF